MLQTSLREFYVKMQKNNNNDEICTEVVMNNREMNNNKTNRINIMQHNEMFAMICGQI